MKSIVSKVVVWTVRANQANGIAIALWSAVLAFLVAGASAPAQTLPLGGVRDPVVRHLDNGMSVIVKADRRAPTLVHMLWVRAGSMDEMDGRSGVAHVLEHMMFKGSSLLGPGEFSRRVARLGGRENAFTSRDYTGYFQQVPAAMLEQVMLLEADRFLTNRWDDAEFLREIEVVKEERRLRTDDNPRARLHETLQAIAFLAAPYRRPVVGWMSDLETLTPNDVREFHASWYNAGNAAVVVVGDVDVDSVMALAERIYGALPSGKEVLRRRQVEPAQVGERRFELKARAEQAYVVLGFKVPSITADPSQSPAQRRDVLALLVLAAVLDGHAGARLDRYLTQGLDRVADSVGASYGPLGRGPQLFVLDGVPSANRGTVDVERALRAQVARIAAEGVTDAELSRVKTQWIANETYRQDALMAQAQELGRNWISGLPVDFGRTLVGELRTVTAAEVRAVAGRYFNDEQLTVGVLRPEVKPDDPQREPKSPINVLRH